MPSRLETQFLEHGIAHFARSGRHDINWEQRHWELVLALAPSLSETYDYNDLFTEADDILKLYFDKYGVESTGEK